MASRDIINKQERRSEEYRNEGRPLPTGWPPVHRMGGGGGGGSVGISVYKYHTNHATPGQYNCYLQTWVAGDWANANTTDVVVKDILDTGNEFGSGDYFIAVGAADASGIVPVIPYGYAHAY